MRVTRYRVALAGLLLVVLAFYMWTAASTIPFSFSSVNDDYYNQLTTAFLHGHTYLPEVPPPALLHLKNPYDPTQNAPYAGPFHDLALHNGRFYATWGATPVVTLFAPFRITGFSMSLSFAVALYGFLGLVCAVALLHAVVRRFAPRTPGWLLLVASAGLALTNTVPFLLRRPIQYEVAISCGYCFEMAGVLFVLTAILGPVARRRRLALGSLCLGLAVGARPDLVLSSAIAAAVGVWLVRRRNESRVILAYALGPLVLCGLVIAAYNDVRFGSPANFGERYALAGVDQLNAPFDKVRWIVPGLLSYLYVPVRLSLTFPHAFLQTAGADPITLPSQYFGSPPFAEPAGGVFTTMPITLLLLAFPAFWWRRRPGDRPLLLIAGGLAAMGLAIAVLLAYSVNATTERYEVDFVTFMLLGSFLLWAVWLDRWRLRSLGRRVIAIGGVILTLFGAAIGLGISFTGYADLLQIEHPSTFAALEDATAPLVTLATMIRGKPEITRVASPLAPVLPPPTGDGAFTQDGSGVWLGTAPATVTIVAPSSGTVHMLASATAGAGAPPASTMVILARNGTHRPSVTPVIGPGVWIPIPVHLGLNRVRLTLAGHATSLEELLLSNLQVSG